MKILTSCKIKSSIQQKLIENYPAVDFSFHSSIKEAEKELSEAEVLITYGEDLNDAYIYKANTLKWIMVLSAGIEKMPLKAIKQKRILVTNVKGIHKTPMAEYTIGMMLQIARKAKQLIKNEQEEVWDRKVKMIELSEKTVTILGAGAIGSEIARLCKAFHMKTVGVNRSGRKVDNIDEIFTVSQLDQALALGDYVVSVLPSTPETFHLLKLPQFQCMKNECVFINIGRGSVVKEDDLLLALKQKEIAHAVLDVFETEPLPKGHPLWKMENVTITPHLSGLSSPYQERAIEIFEYNLQQYLSGSDKLINLIDINRGY